MTREYRLTGVLQGHTDDVKAVASPSRNTILSVSRDCTARVWTRESNVMAWTCSSVLAGYHEGFVNAVVNALDGSKPLVATGGQDAVIQLWDLEAPEQPVGTLLGHLANVCCLKYAAGSLYSGSWDGTARRWDLAKRETTAVLDHELNGVWDVLPLANGSLITACADGLIRIWDGDEVATTLKGHQAAVRSLAALPGGDMFASGSNDETIRIWSSSGKPLSVIEGQGSFVYSITALPEAMGGGLASSGEDGLVKLWHPGDGSCVQTIEVPATSVWCVTALENGDLAIGTSDNDVWVFSKEGEASTEVQQSYDEKMADFIKARALKKAAKEAPASSQQVEHEGKLYDFVFTIAPESSGAHLQLPYNRGEDPKVAAQAFLEHNKLPVNEETVSQIVDFISLHAGFSIQMQ